jgi:hypothetical protein
MVRHVARDFFAPGCADLGSGDTWLRVDGAELDHRDVEVGRRRCAVSFDLVRGQTLTCGGVDWWTTTGVTDGTYSP